MSVSMPRRGIQEDENSPGRYRDTHACRGYFQSSPSLLLPLHQVGKLDSWEDFQDRQAMTLFTMRRHGAKNADYRGGVTCLYDTQLLSACLHASECGGRSRPEAVRGMPDVPIAPPATGPPEGWAAVGFVSPASFNRGLWARLLRVLGS